MKAFELYDIRKPYFGYEEIARIRGISPASAKVTASRYVTQGLLVRLKKNLYMLRQVWQTAGIEEKLRLANLVQAPSYISLTTALAYYEVTTQIQQDFFESAALRRTKEVRIDGTVFRYTKIDTSLYFGFKREKGIFIASPEKALLDAFYLMSFGRYALDLAALDGNKLNLKSVRQLSNNYPVKTQHLVQSHGYL
jgi:predicted transcriptional regulator of viral defense system